MSFRLTTIIVGFNRSVFFAIPGVLVKIYVAIPTNFSRFSPPPCSNICRHRLHFIDKYIVFYNTNIVKQELERMVKYSGYVFAFLDNQHIPPDNNASERAIRNFKVKLKVSNFFKSTAGSENYAVIRSVIDTAIKNQQNPYEATLLIAILPATE